MFALWPFVSNRVERSIGDIADAAGQCPVQIQQLTEAMEFIALMLVIIAFFMLCTLLKSSKR